MIEQISSLFSKNPVLTTLMSMYGIGIITFLLKDIPKRILNFCIRTFSTKMSICSNVNSFYKFMELLANRDVSNKIRSINLLNGKWGQDKKTTKGLGEGFHFIWYSKTLLKINVKREQTHYNDDKIFITVSKLGRSHKIFNSLIKEIQSKTNFNSNKTTIWVWKDMWIKTLDAPKRELETILLPQKTKNKILNSIDSFIKNEKWYLEVGVPYQLGILLYGPPGVGKTSMIKALAGHFNYNLCILTVKDLSKLQEAISNLPEQSILVIEDIDSSISVKKRKENSKGDRALKTETVNEISSTEAMLDDIISYSLSDILNAVDGLLNVHGRILIFTTNFIEKLDPALLRPGRIDLKIKLDIVDNEMFELFSNRFFNKDIKVSNIKKEVTISELQNNFLQGDALEDIIEKYEIDILDTN